MQAVWKHFICFSVVFFHILKQFPIYFSCLGECCNAAKLHKCFVNYESSADFPSACDALSSSGVHFHFLVNLSFKNTMQYNVFTELFDTWQTSCEEDWYVGTCNRVEAEHALHLVNKVSLLVLK